MVQRFSITLTQLTYFLECATTLNMTEASQNLHVAQSAISTAITNLERSLGVSLYIRQHSKGLLLTPAGEQLLRDTNEIFGLLTDSTEALRTNQTSVRGSIRIGCFSTLAPFLLPRLLSRIQAEHPELIVEVLEGDYDDNLAALRGGRAELSIGYMLSNAEGISYDIVGEVRPYILLPEQHRLADRDSISLAELTGEDFVLLDMPSSRDYFLNILTAAGLEPRITYRSASYETVRAMVGEKLGFSILNQRPITLETYTGGRVVQVEITDDVPSLSIAVAALEQLRPSARSRAVADTVRRILS